MNGCEQLTGNPPLPMLNDGLPDSDYHSLIRGHLCLTNDLTSVQQPLATHDEQTTTGHERPVGGWTGAGIAGLGSARRRRPHPPGTGTAGPQ